MNFHESVSMISKALNIRFRNAVVFFLLVLFVCLLNTKSYSQVTPTRVVSFGTARDTIKLLGFVQIDSSFRLPHGNAIIGGDVSIAGNLNSGDATLNSLEITNVPDEAVLPVGNNLLIYDATTGVVSELPPSALRTTLTSAIGAQNGITIDATSNNMELGGPLTKPITSISRISSANKWTFEASPLTDGEGIEALTNNESFTGDLLRLSSSGDDARVTGDVLALNISGSNSGATGLRITNQGRGNSLVINDGRDDVAVIDDAGNARFDSIRVENNGNIGGALVVTGDISGGAISGSSIRTTGGGNIGGLLEVSGDGIINGDVSIRGYLTSNATRVSTLQIGNVFRESVLPPDHTVLIYDNAEDSVKRIPASVLTSSVNVANGLGIDRATNTIKLGGTLAERTTIDGITGGQNLIFNASNLTNGVAIAATTNNTGFVGSLLRLSSTASNVAVTGSVLHINVFGGNSRANGIRVVNAGSGNSLLINDGTRDVAVIDADGNARFDSIHVENNVAIGGELNVSGKARVNSLQIENVFSESVLPNNHSVLIYDNAEDSVKQIPASVLTSSVNAANGLSIDRATNTIKLGGTLTERTIIRSTAVGQNLIFNASGLVAGQGLHVLTDNSAFGGDLLALTSSGNNSGVTGNGLNITISGSNSGATGLRITNEGTGNALVINDGTSDVVVIDEDGNTVLNSLQIDNVFRESVLPNDHTVLIYDNAEDSVKRISASALRNVNNGLSIDRATNNIKLGGTLTEPTTITSTAVGRNLTFDAPGLVAGQGLHVLTNNSAFSGDLLALTSSGNNSGVTGNGLNITISGSNSGATGLRITNEGTGNALVINDGTSDVAVIDEDGNARFDSIHVENNATIGRDLSVSGNVSVGDSLLVTNSIRGSNISATSDGDIGGDLAVSGDVSITGNLISGDAILNSLQIDTVFSESVLPNDHSVLIYDNAEDSVKRIPASVLTSSVNVANGLSIDRATNTIKLGGDLTAPTELGGISDANKLTFDASNLTNGVAIAAKTNNEGFSGSLLRLSSRASNVAVTGSVLNINVFGRNSRANGIRVVNAGSGNSLVINNGTRDVAVIDDDGNARFDSIHVENNVAIGGELNVSGKARVKRLNIDTLFLESVLPNNHKVLIYDSLEHNVKQIPASALTSSMKVDNGLSIGEVTNAIDLGGMLKKITTLGGIGRNANLIFESDKTTLSSIVDDPASGGVQFNFIGIHEGQAMVMRSATQTGTLLRMLADNLTSGKALHISTSSPRLSGALLQLQTTTATTPGRLMHLIISGSNSEATGLRITNEGIGNSFAVDNATRTVASIDKEGNTQVNSLKIASVFSESVLPNNHSVLIYDNTEDSVKQIPASALTSSINANNGLTIDRTNNTINLGGRLTKTTTLNGIQRDAKLIFQSDAITLGEANPTSGFVQFNFTGIHSGPAMVMNTRTQTGTLLRMFADTLTRGTALHILTSSHRLSGALLKLEATNGITTTRGSLIDLNISGNGKVEGIRITNRSGGNSFIVKNRTGTTVARIDSQGNTFLNTLSIGSVTNTNSVSGSYNVLLYSDASNELREIAASNLIKARNGLTVSENHVELGDSLIKETIISGITPSKDLEFQSTSGGNFGNAMDGAIRFNFSGTHSGNALLLRTETQEGTGLNIIANQLTIGNAIYAQTQGTNFSGALVRLSSLGNSSNSNGYLMDLSIGGANSEVRGIRITNEGSANSFVMVKGSSTVTSIDGDGNANFASIATTNDATIGGSLVVRNDATITGSLTSGLATVNSLKIDTVFSETSLPTEHTVLIYDKADDSVKQIPASALISNGLTFNSSTNAIELGGRLSRETEISNINPSRRLKFLSSATRDFGTDALSGGVVFNFFNTHSGQAVSISTGTQIGTALRISAGNLTSGSALDISTRSDRFSGSLLKLSSTANNRQVDGYLLDLNISGGFSEAKGLRITNAGTDNSLVINDGTNNVVTIDDDGLLQASSIAVGDHDPTTDDKYTLPIGRGADGQYLKTDGSGNTTWGTPELSALPNQVIPRYPPGRNTSNTDITYSISDILNIGRDPMNPTNQELRNFPGGIYAYRVFATEYADSDVRYTSGHLVIKYCGSSLACESTVVEYFSDISIGTYFIEVRKVVVDGGRNGNVTFALSSRNSSSTDYYSFKIEPLYYSGDNNTR